MRSSCQLDPIVVLIFWLTVINWGKFQICCSQLYINYLNSESSQNLIDLRHKFRRSSTNSEAVATWCKFDCKLNRHSATSLTIENRKQAVGNQTCRVACCKETLPRWAALIDPDLLRVFATCNLSVSINCTAVIRESAIVWRQIASHPATCLNTFQSKVVTQKLRVLHAKPLGCRMLKDSTKSPNNYQFFQVARGLPFYFYSSVTQL